MWLATYPLILKTKEDLESQDIKRSSIITFTNMSFCEKLQQSRVVLKNSSMFLHRAHY